jgi:hypothetical protein
MLTLARRSSQQAAAQGTEETSLSLSPDDANNGNDSNNDMAGNGKADAAPKKPRKRVRHFTSHDRAAHRVFERARREAFREKLIELAELLPSLEDADTSRLSKHLVVHESIARHHEQIRQIDALTRERDKLQAEVTRWRAQPGAEAGAQAGFVGAGAETPLPGSEVELSPPPSLSLPLSLPLTMPLEQQQQQPSAPLLLDNTTPPLSLGDMGHNVSDSAPWSWSPAFNLHRDLGEAEVSLPWSSLYDADIGQLVADSMGPPVPSLPQNMARTDGHREIEDVIVANTSSQSRHNGLLQPPPEQILWMVS